MEKKYDRPAKPWNFDRIFWDIDVSTMNVENKASFIIEGFLHVAM